jgi:hypothetical protein
LKNDPNHKKCKALLLELEGGGSDSGTEPHSSVGENGASGQDSNNADTAENDSGADAEENDDSSVPGSSGFEFPSGDSD